VSFHEYALETGADPQDWDAVKRCNPLPSITPESLRSKRSSETMTAAHWSRFVCNLATRSTEAAIAEVEWHNAATLERPPASAEIWLGFDVGFQHDTTAIVPLWWSSEEKRVLLPAVVLEPPGGGEQLDVRQIRAAFTALRDEYPGLSTVVMDSSRAEDIAAWLSDELGLTVVYRAQTAKPQAEDFERFMAALRQGWLLHSGDEALRRHALNAVAKLLLDGGSRFGRVSESRSGQNHLRVIDALIAAAMVHSYAVESRSAAVWVI
jgi:phage terminase large subunit-like protein